MKNLFQVLLIAFINLQALADVTDKYQRMAQIQTSANSGAFEAELPPDLLEGILNNDFRLFSKNFHEVPYLVETADFRKEENFQKLQIINQAIVEGQKQIIELSLGESNLEKLNELVLQIKEANFNRNVAVLGRNKTTDKWLLIRDGLKIIASKVPNQKIDFNHNSVLIPESHYKFFRLEVPFGPAEKPLSITDVQARYLTQKGEVKFHRIPLSLTKSEFKSETENTDYWQLSSNGKKYFLESLEVEFDANNFYREVNLYCSQNTELKPNGDPKLRLLTNSVMFKYNANQNTKISTEGVICASYILQISRKDNVLVSPIAAYGLSKKSYIKFIIEPPFEPPLTIFTKSHNPEAPSYDLLQRFTKNSINEFQPAVVRKVMQNPKYKSGLSVDAWSFKQNAVVYLAAIGLLIGIAILIKGLSKK
jgi:hypothetical protein